MPPKARQATVLNAHAFAVERSRILGAFSENVKKARAVTPHSQEALARIARIHRTEVSQIERAQSEPRLLTILILAGALNVGPALLLDGLPVPQERRSPNYPKRGE